MLRLYTDAHIDRELATQLRQRGIDVLRCEEIGRKHDTDIAHLEFATSDNRSVVTCDRDFAMLHKQWLETQRSHAGIFCIVDNPILIGHLVTTFAFWNEALLGGAATREDDLYNNLYFI